MKFCIKDDIMIKENLDDVCSRIKAACERANRSVDEVTLIAVSKTMPNEALQEAMDTGIVEFGENKVQELVGKIEFFNNSKINWHMIGHLQTNKVKYIIDKVCMIHSVDSFALAKKISDRAVLSNVTVNILIEVNAALEETKFGLKCEEVIPFVNQISQLPNIKIRGLMTVAPYVENPEDNRKIFKEVYNLKEKIKSLNLENVPMDVLSMGMTNDFEIAIEEGATMVRVGTAIFGKRNYNI